MNTAEIKAKYACDKSLGQLFLGNRKDVGKFKKYGTMGNIDKAVARKNAKESNQDPLENKKNASADKLRAERKDVKKKMDAVNKKLAAFESLKKQAYDLSVRYLELGAQLEKMGEKKD